MSEVLVQVWEHSAWSPTQHSFLSLQPEFAAQAVKPVLQVQVKEPTVLAQSVFGPQLLGKLPSVHSLTSTHPWFGV